MDHDTLSFWDQQFRFASLLPDFQYWLDKSVNQSAEFSSQHAAPVTLHYGEHPRQWLEVFNTVPTGMATKDELLPVFIHGGFWRAQVASTYRFLMPGLAAFGSIQANLEYRLMPEVRMADVVADVKNALHTLLQHTQHSRKLLLIGHSAGGHLVMEAGLDQALQPHIAGIIPISGIFDLTPIPYSFLQAELSLQAEEIRDFSPSSRIAAGGPLAKVLPVVGALETYEFHRQAELLASQLNSRVVRVTAAHHMNVLQALAQPDNGLVTLISHFLAGKQHQS